MKTNPSTIAILLLILAGAVYAGCIRPMSTSLLKARKQLSDQENRLSEIQLGSRQQSSTRERISVLERENGEHRDTLLVPVLTSYAMRAKSLVDTMAVEAGLTEIEYTEGPVIALPVAKGVVPTMRMARRSVRIKAMADYAAVASFLLRVEKELPLAALQSLAIRQPKVARTQQQEVEIVLEWPAKGEGVK